MSHLNRIDSAPLGVGTRFKNLSATSERALSEVLIHGCERLVGPGHRLSWTDPKLIESLLRLHAFKRAQPLQGYQDDGPAAFHLRLLGIVIDGDQRSLAAERLDQRSGSLVRDTECRIVMPSDGSLHHFRASILGQDARLLRLTFPSELIQTGLRDSIRARLPAQSACIRFLDPNQGELTRPIGDVGARGFSFDIARDTNSMVPGQRIAELRVSLPEGEIEASGVIRSISPIAVSDSYACGVQIDAFAGARDEKRWNHFVFHKTHPSVTLDADRSAPISWDVLDSSGYLSEWTSGASRNHIAESYRNDWLAMSEKNGHILLLRDGARPIGTLAGNRLYPKTWMVHQLGIDREERTPGKHQRFAVYSRELYSGFAYLVQHVASAKYFAIYVEQGKRWNTMLYEDFVRSYSDGSSSLLTTNTVYKFYRSSLQAPAPHSDVDVVLARGRDLPDLSARLSHVVLLIEMDAFSYYPDEIGLQDFARDCSDCGYERARTIYLASRSGTLSACLIAETGGEGTNVFGLLNTCRIVNLDGEGDVHPDVKRSLLETAIQHYRNAAKVQFIFVDDLNVEDKEVTQLGFELVSAGIRWIVHRGAVPAWLSFTDQIFRIQSNRRKRYSNE